MSDDHTPPACPTCNRPTIHSTVGDICIHCNSVIKHGPISPVPHLSTEHIPTPQDEQVQEETGLPVMGVTPASTLNVSTNDAIRFRHRLKARVRRLVVPELPSSISPNHELESALKSPPPLLPIVNAVSQQTPQPEMQPSQVTSAIDESRHTHAFDLAEAIAELDTEQIETQPSENLSSIVSQPTQPASEQEAIPPRPQAETQNNISSELNQDPKLSKEITSEESKQAKKLSRSTLITTLVAIVLIVFAGLWMIRHSPKTTPITNPNAAISQSSSRNPKTSPEALARDSQRKADLKAIATALEVYKQQIGAYSAGDDISAVYQLQYTSPPYIGYINYDPSSTATGKIKYNYASNGQVFALSAKLESITDTEAIAGLYTVKNK